MAEQEELNYQQQRRRLFGEVAQEKEKMADQLQRQRISLDLQLKENTRMNDRLEELIVVVGLFALTVFCLSLSPLPL